MKKKLWLLYPVLALSLALSLVMPALSVNATTIKLPHNFYGSVTIGTKPAPAGTEVEARGVGVMTTGVNPITTTEEGQYGGPGPLDPKLEVQGDIDEGTLIEFWIDGVRAQCQEPGDEAWQDSYPFENGGMTELNLIIADLTDLDAAITSAQALVETDYTEASWAALQTELTAALVVQLDPAATQAEVDAATTALTDAMGALVDVVGRVVLLEGWNLLSTPILLDADSDSMGQIFDTESLDNIQIYYSWDGEDWDQVLTDYELLPLYGIYIKVSSGASATAVFTPSGELSWLPSRELQRGLNLIGPAPALEEGAFPDMPLDVALASIALAEGDLRGYTMVVSPAHNQTPWSYALGGAVKDLVPYKGYWVVMENGPDTLFGFSTTGTP